MKIVTLSVAQNNDDDSGFEIKHVHMIRLNWILFKIQDLSHTRLYREYII